MTGPSPDTVEGWAPARLIPASGIRGAKEQEQRATSALLAVMSVVPSFGKRILKTADAPGGSISTYTEPSFQTDEGGTVRPDGAIVVERGQTRWSCLVEVKTGSSELGSEQINSYLAIANRDGFDAVLTISNQIVSERDESPVVVDRRRLRKVKLGHISWFRILTEAIIEHEHHGVSDPEQAFILGDLIAYLDDDRSGAGGFDGMGGEWVRVREAARNKTLRTRDPGVAEVAEDWEEFVEYLALRLRQRLGRAVAPVYSRSSNHKSRVDEYGTSLGNEGVLRASIKVPDAVAPIDLETDLGSLQVTTITRVKAPGEGRAKTRINWMLRQLRDAPKDLRVSARFARTRTTTSLLLPDAQANPEALLLPDDPKREPVAFDVALTRDMGVKRGKTKGSFVIQTMEQVLAFYGEVVQDIQPWTPRAPRLAEPTETSPSVAQVAEQPTAVPEWTLAAYQGVDTPVH